MPDRRTIHLVDDDEAIRHSASFMLRHGGFDVKTYPDGLKFLEGVTHETQGCVLLDVRMPVLDGMGVLRAMATRGIVMPVIVLTGHGDVAVAVEAMKAGAVDFLEKPYEKKALMEAINNAFEKIGEDDIGHQRAARAQAAIARLTARETEVLHCLVDGMTNKSVAQELDISPRTVEIHRANLMEKLGADSLSAALKIAFAAGIGLDADQT